MSGRAARGAAAWAARSAAAAVVLLAASPAAAFAHAGRPLRPHDLWGAWTWSAGITVPLGLAAFLYARGVRALWRASAPGRGVRPWAVAAFALGWLLLAAALVSPLHALGGVLFSAHMAQHELMMVAAAPLLVLGRPLIPFLWALPIEWRRRAGGWTKARWASSAWGGLTGVFVATAVHAGALWAWHAPRPYQATLRSEWLHALQHASFLGTALLFWWAVLHARAAGGGRGASALCLFATATHTTLLGALLTFAPALWYPAYASTTGPWGLTPLEDQQLGGLIMWVPGGVSYLAATLVIVALWMRDAERGVERRERWREELLLELSEAEAAT